MTIFDYNITMYKKRFQIKSSANYNIVVKFDWNCKNREVDEAVTLKVIICNICWPAGDKRRRGKK